MNANSRADKGLLASGRAIPFGLLLDLPFTLVRGPTAWPLTCTTSSNWDGTPAHQCRFRGRRRRRGGVW